MARSRRLFLLARSLRLMKTWGAQAELLPLGCNHYYFCYVLQRIESRVLNSEYLTKEHGKYVISKWRDKMFPRYIGHLAAER
jgi:hypothetical protein